jgi:TPR repeat protein
MANLMGQLGHPRDPTRAVPLLKQAADLSDVDVPQPSYVYGMLLLGEFNHVDIPSALFLPYLSTGGATLRTEEERDEARHAEARKYIERGSYLNFAPAQYKSGWSYEYAKMGCAFDPLLSVSYYTLASEQGEVEADMALSKWFLCGAEGAFDKDEGLAYTFAERAAKKGLPSAEFAMGYYLEVGVGGRKDLNEARRWYELVSNVLSA